MSRPLFELGAVVATPGAMELLETIGRAPSDFLGRHVTGDFGELCEEDREANRLAIEDGARVLSSYEVAPGEKLWVITEADRSSTCLLRPFEY